jgi:acyl-CoA thioesterase-1
MSRIPTWKHSLILVGLIAVGINLFATASAAQDADAWQYSPNALKPFWQTDVIDGESVLFLRDTKSGIARASLLFPIKEVIAVRDSTGQTTYTEGIDFRYTPVTTEIEIPAGSKIVTKTSADLRVPANSQRYRLTHRDGNGEILFGATLEYHNMQTWITYSKAENSWPVELSSFDPKQLPHTVETLRSARPLHIVLLGDSISTGCNASGWADGAPQQPAYPELLKLHLEAHYKAEVELTNLSVSGMSTPWGVTMMPKVIEHRPDLVIIAFGMNDSASRSAMDYRTQTETMIATARKALPNVEFILVASMLGNRDWTVLKHDVFPQYRDELANLCQPGIALADMTSVWAELLKRKQDHDLTGNGVNHPNDFGHRVYAQVLSLLLVDDSQ